VKEHGTAQVSIEGCSFWKAARTKETLTVQDMDLAEAGIVKFVILDNEKTAGALLHGGYDERKQS